MTQDLVRWLGEQLDEDERIARAASDAAEPFPADALELRLTYGGSDRDVPMPVLDCYVRFGAVSRVLREIDAKRQIVDRYAWLREHGDTGGTARVLPLLALPYADRPGYREDWRP